jgi:hypothetical protein
MKKLIVLSAVMAVLLCAGGSLATCNAQDAAKDETPTFYHLVPGTYVNGWPRFTIHYPKDWVEIHPLVQEVFRAGIHRPVRPLPQFLHVTSEPNPLPLDKVASPLFSYAKNLDKEAIIVSDKPSQMADGTPAREIEIRFAVNGTPINWLTLGWKKGNLFIHPGVAWDKGKIGEDLKAVLYSIEFEPGHDEPVTVPEDVKELLDRQCGANVAHDVAQVMAGYSDKYLNSGKRKGEVEGYVKQSIGRTISFEIGITDFIPAGDKAYLTGFMVINGGRFPLSEISVIKEYGEWKWYGNQRDAAP